MWRLRSIASRLRALFAAENLDTELQGEIAEHLRLLTERFVRQGMLPQDAEAAARRQFGSVAQLRESHRETRGLPWIDNFMRDLILSLRRLRKKPGFSLLVIGILALGLGANTAIFTMINGTLLRPLPFSQPEKLAALFEREVIGTGDSFDSVAPANFFYWQKQTTTFDQLAAISYTRLNISDTPKASAERIDACASSFNLFETLGVMPALGRTFTAEEDHPGAARVAIISDALWKRRFNASPTAISSIIKLDSQPYTIAGIMPPDFSYPSRSTQVWIPLRSYLPASVLDAHDNHILTVIGRIRKGVGAAQANAELDAITRRYKEEHPAEIMGRGANVVSLAEYTVKDRRKLLLLLFSAVGCVLLIACVNVANLHLSRAVGRKREVAIRTALGAGRGSMVRQLLIESVVLSLLGGLAGLLMASWLTRYLEDWLPATSGVQFDPVVFLFTFAVTVATGVSAGLIPALEATSSIDIARDLKEGGRSSTGAKSQNRFREILVVAEVSLSLILLLASSLLLRSFGHLLSTDLGVRTSNTLTMRVSLPDAKYHARAQVSSFLKNLAEQMRSIPGVRSAGLTSCPVITQPGFCPDTVFQIERQAPLRNGPPDAQYRGVDPDFFQAAGIPILKGRALTPVDGIGLDDKHPQAGAVVINEALAKRFFPSKDPIGQYITLFWFVGDNMERTSLRYRIAGVAANVLERPQSPPQPTFYMPLLDGDSTDISIILHTAIDSPAVAAAARSVIHAMDPDLPIYGLQSMSESVSETIRDQKFIAAMLAAFAGIAICLAAAGLYGVVSWGVSQRTNEIAIRMALGASRRELHRMVLMNGLWPSLIGIAIGIPAAVAVATLLRGFLFDIRPVDPFAFAIAPLLLLAVTFLACIVPALRATRIDPTLGLRTE